GILGRVAILSNVWRSRMPEKSKLGVVNLNGKAISPKAHGLNSWAYHFHCPGAGMSHSFGHWLPLSLPRRFLNDLIHFAEQVPSRTMERQMDLASVVVARQSAWPRPAWCSIFLKAYAIVAQRRPQLRRLYRPLPWPHLYEHPENVVS